MPVSAAYLAVILIWSTTPLGIVWSSESVTPALAVLLRMLIAVVIGLVIILVTRINLPWTKQAKTLYCYSAIGIFGGMICSYLSARYISSGMMSLVFGLAPILSGLMAQKVLNEGKFGTTRTVAMAISLIGLAVVCSTKFNYQPGFIFGLLLILGAVFFFSLSGVLVKSVAISIHPVATTVGALLVSLPLFFLSWLIFDGELSTNTWQLRSLWAIVYLGIFGSLIGFVAYYFVLQKLSAATVALITMITPVVAISLGAIFNNETIDAQVIIGASLVMVGLWIYHFGYKHVEQKKRLKV
ncbi:DMT family transporter [Thalassotalea sp. PLHSN55]|uniref:DMT family transporter n=1 Tax=Thalassotalea sp. PLHSN55 TaxID=3435888 RepID=UPI003F835D2F